MFVDEQSEGQRGVSAVGSQRGIGHLAIGERDGVSAFYQGASLVDVLAQDLFRVPPFGPVGLHSHFQILSGAGRQKTPRTGDGVEIPRVR